MNEVHSEADHDTQADDRSRQELLGVYKKNRGKAKCCGRCLKICAYCQIVCLTLALIVMTCLLLSLYWFREQFKDDPMAGGIELQIGPQLLSKIILGGLVSLAYWWIVKKATSSPIQAIYEQEQDSLLQIKNHASRTRDLRGQLCYAFLIRIIISLVPVMQLLYLLVFPPQPDFNQVPARDPGVPDPRQMQMQQDFGEIWIIMAEVGNIPAIIIASAVEWLVIRNLLGKFQGYLEVVEESVMNKQEKKQA